MKQRLVTTVILLVYCAILIKIMVFKEVPVIRIGPLMLNFGGTQEGPANLIPFKTILPYLLGEKGFIIAGLNIGGNIALLMPIGLLVPLIYRYMTWKKTILIAFATGFAIEGMQVLLHVGIFDIDDVILNGLGVMIGYWLFIILSKMSRPLRSKIIIFTSVMLVTAVAAFYGFAVYHANQRPGPFGPGAYRSQLPGSDEPTGGNNLSDSSGNGKTSHHRGDDPCNGTGGTGKIIHAGVHEITIQGKDGNGQVIHLSNQTKIRSSEGPIAEADLKIGYGVTIVTGLDDKDDKTAMLVLVCNTESLKQ